MKISVILLVLLSSCSHQKEYSIADAAPSESYYPIVSIPSVEVIPNFIVIEEVIISTHKKNNNHRSYCIQRRKPNGEKVRECNIK